MILLSPRQTIPGRYPGISPAGGKLTRPMSSATSSNSVSCHMSYSGLISIPGTNHLRAAFHGAARTPTGQGQVSSRIQDLPFPAPSIVTVDSVTTEYHRRIMWSWPGQITLFDDTDILDIDAEGVIMGGKRLRGRLDRLSGSLGAPGLLGRRSRVRFSLSRISDGAVVIAHKSLCGNKDDFISHLSSGRLHAPSWRGYGDATQAGFRS